MVAFLDVVPAGVRDNTRVPQDRSILQDRSIPQDRPMLQDRAGLKDKPVMTENPAQGARRAGRRAVAGLLRFTGVVLMLAAVGIWILSVPLLDAEMMLLRLAVSVLFMCTGLMLLHAGRPTLRDEIHLDPRRRELRHVQRDRDGIARTRRSFAMAELGEITINDDHLILRSTTGEVVMELSGLPRAQLHLIDRELRNI